MYRFGLLIALLLGIALAFCACKGGGMPDPGIIEDGGASAWGMAGGGPMRRGLSAYAGPITPDIAWEYVIDGDLRGSPVFTADGLVCVSARFVVLAFDQFGQLLWRYVGAGGIVEEPYAALDGTVMVACYDGTIARLEADGTPRWETTIPDVRQIRSRVFAPDGSSYVWVELESGRQLVGLDTDGAIKWRNDVERSYTLYEAAHGLLFLRTSDADLAVYDAGGTLRWELPRSEDSRSDYFGSTPGGAAIVLTRYFDDRESELQAYDLEGSLRWSHAPEIAYPAAIIVDGAGNTLVATRDSGLVAVSASGELHTTPEGGYWPVCTDLSGTAYAVGRDYDLLYALDAEGKSTNEWPLVGYTGFEAVSDLGFVAVSGYVYSTTDNLHQEGLHLLSFAGEHLWEYPAGSTNTYSMLVDGDGNCIYNSETIIGGLSQTGSSLYRNRYDHWIRDRLAIGPQGNLHVCDDNHRLRTFTWDGEPLWDTMFGGNGSPHHIAATEAGFYIPSDFLFYMLDPDGERRYAFVAQYSIEGGAAIGPDGTAYFLDSGELCYAVDPDGAERWRVETDDTNFWQHPVVAGEDQILFSADGGMVALDAAGQERWRFQLDDCLAWIAPAVAADGSIYLPLRKEAPGVPGGTPTGGEAPADPYASVSSSSTSNTPVAVSAVPDDLELPGLCALSAGGELKWFHPLPAAVPTFAQPVVDRDGRVYVLSGDADLYALNPDGSELWTLELDSFDVGSATGLAISPQGRLVVMRGAVITAIGP